MPVTPLKTSFPSVRDAFNLQSLKSVGLRLLVKEMPCLGLSLISAVTISSFSHDPRLEIAVALGVAVGFEHIEHKYFPHIKPLISGTGLVAMVKRYGLAIGIGLAAWGLHHTLLHDHDKHDASEHAMRLCEDPKQYPIFHDDKARHIHEHKGNQHYDCAFR